MYSKLKKKNAKKKPPITVKSKMVWIEERIKELSKALHDSILMNRYGDKVKGWLKEIDLLIIMWEDAQKEEAQKEDDEETDDEEDEF